MEAQVPKVVVLGAGIVGLQTTLNLIEAGIKVTVVSKFWPGDRDIEYTSPWSGAQWRPNVSMNDISQQKWNTETFIYWLEEVKKHSPNTSGLEMNSAVLYWDANTVESEHPENHIWYSSLVPDFQKLHNSQLPQESNIAAGVSYKTFCLSPTRFLQHRLQIYAFQLESCSDASGMINCTGLGSRELVPDLDLFPTKGQTIIVQGKAKKISIRTGGRWENHVVPQPGSNTTLLSGCKLDNDWSTHAEEEINNWIMERCKPLAPELLDQNGCFEVLALQVGRRPSRKGGPRVELEFLKVADGGTKFICHNYGHGSSGYENSAGTANDATRLVLEALSGIHSLV